MELLDFTSNEKFVHCPYNPVHTMPYKTLVLHLAKCPDKSKPSSKRFKNCMYNDLHVVHENELEAHEKKCLNRIQLDTILSATTNSQPPNIIVEKKPTVLYKESWDEPEETVNICERVNQKINIMKPICGLSKLKRRQLRAKLHEQYPYVDLSCHADSSVNSIRQNDQQNKKNI